MKVNLLQRGMPISEGKKVENITAKVNAEQKALFEEVSRKEDRTVSYIVRELALRGQKRNSLNNSLIYRH